MEYHALDNGVSRWVSFLPGQCRPDQLVDSIDVHSHRVLLLWASTCMENRKCGCLVQSAAIVFTSTETGAWLSNGPIARPQNHWKCNKFWRVFSRVGTTAQDFTCWTEFPFLCIVLTISFRTVQLQWLRTSLQILTYLILLWTRPGHP